MLSSPPPPTPTFFLRIIINFKPIYFCKFINPCFFPPSPRGTHRTGEITPGSRVHCFYAGPGGGEGRGSRFTREQGFLNMVQYLVKLSTTGYLEKYLTACNCRI